MKKILLIVFVFLLMSSFTNASMQQVNVEISEVQDRVQPGGTAVFEFFIENKGVSTEYLTLTGDPFIGMDTSDFADVEFSEDYLILEGGESKNIIIEIVLKEDVDPGKYYQTFLKLKSMTTDEIIEYPVSIYIIPPESVINLDIEPDFMEVNPGGRYEFQMLITNNLNTKLSNLKIYISSEFFSEEENIQLFALQDRSDSYSIPIDQYTEPGYYDVSVRIYQDEQLLDSKTAVIEVVENLAISSKEEKVKDFLKYSFSVTKTNNGNTRQTESYFMDMSWFTKMFAEFSPEPIEKQGYLEWQYSIDPGETISLSYTVDYRPLGLALLLIILFALFAVYWFTRGVTIKKSVYKLHQTQEGILKLKIMLHVKNNSRKRLSDVTVIDLLPSVIHPEAHFGTLHPTKEEKGSRGTRLTWKIRQLVSGEERIITYTVSSRVNVIGNITLPPAVLRYRGNNKKITTVRSNTFTYSSGFVKHTP